MARRYRVSPNRITEEQLEEFDVIIVISGSRVYNDYNFFSMTVRSYLEREEFEGKTVCFVTGEAYEGPDDMIITLCDELELPFYGRPANWQKYGNSAGHVRNAEMADLGTHLLAFHAENSDGTAGMIKVSRKKGLKVERLIVDSDAQRRKLNGESVAKNGTERRRELHHRDDRFAASW